MNRRKRLRKKRRRIENDKKEGKLSRRERLRKKKEEVEKDKRRES